MGKLSVMIKTILSLCVGALIFAFFNWLAPVLTGYQDSKECAPYKHERVNGVLYCKCSDSEIQKPGKCGSKYK